MQIKILGPLPKELGLQTFGSALLKALSNPTTKAAYIAVAYLHGGAVKPVGLKLKKILNAGGKVDVIVGIKNSSAQALRDLAEIIGANNVHIYWHNVQGIFHPKLYIISDSVNLAKAKQILVFIGSSNFTGAGLNYNLEMNAQFSLQYPHDKQEIKIWQKRWTAIRALKGVHNYSDGLLKELEKRGAFSSPVSSPKLADLFPGTDIETMPINIQTNKTYVQTLVPNDFPATGESDVIIPKLARDMNPGFWGWSNRFQLSPGGLQQRQFSKTQISFGSKIINTSCRIYYVPSVVNFRLSCHTVRSILPKAHDGFIFTLQINKDNCLIQFFAPDDKDYMDYYLATQPLPNSSKRWGYM
jgi:HKD family nuclease